jgi:preprotein translocase subunit SecD
MKQVFRRRTRVVTIIAVAIGLVAVLAACGEARTSAPATVTVTMERKPSSTTNRKPPGASHSSIAPRPGVELVLEAHAAPGHVVASSDLDSAVSIIRSRLDALGVIDSDVYKREPNQIVIQLAGVHDPEKAAKIIGQTGVLELYDLENNLKWPSIDTEGNPISSTRAYGVLAPVQSLAKNGKPSEYYLFGPKHNLVAGPVSTRAELFTAAHTKLRPGERVFVLPEGLVIVTCGGVKPFPVACPGANADPTQVNYYLFNHRPEITGWDLNAGGVRLDFDQTGQPIVRLSFHSHGDSQFQKVTRELYQRGQLRKAPQHFAIVLDNDMKAFPQIDYTDSTLSDGISGGGEITGVSLEEAQNLALVLKYGALSIPFTVVESHTTR